MKHLNVVAVPSWMLVWALASPALADGLNGARFSEAPKISAKSAAQATARKPQVRILTEANRGSAVTLKTGDTLIVRLPDNSSTGYVWSLVMIPNAPIRLLSQTQRAAKVPAGIVGAAGIHEWKFVASGRASFGRAVYLKLLQLRPFEKGISDTQLWEVKVTVPAS